MHTSTEVALLWKVCIHLQRPANLCRVCKFQQRFSRSNLCTGLQSQGVWKTLQTFANLFIACKISGRGCIPQRCSLKSARVMAMHDTYTQREIHVPSALKTYVQMQIGRLQRCEELCRSCATSVEVMEASVECPYFCRGMQTS